MFSVLLPEVITDNVVLFLSLYMSKQRDAILSVKVYCYRHILHY